MRQARPASGSCSALLGGTCRSSTSRVTAIGQDAVAERLHAACLAHGHRVKLIIHVELYTGLASVTQPPGAEGRC